MHVYVHVHMHVHVYVHVHVHVLAHTYGHVHVHVDVYVQMQVQVHVHVHVHMHAHVQVQYFSNFCRRSARLCPCSPRQGALPAPDAREEKYKNFSFRYIKQITYNVTSLYEL